MTESVLSPEEIQQMYDENEGFEPYIKKSIDLGIDPLKGIAFVKEFMQSLNLKKIELEKKYRIDSDIQCMVLIIAKRKDSDDEKEPAPAG